MSIKGEECVIYLYKAHHPKSWENSEKVDFKRGGRVGNLTRYKAHHCRICL